MSVSAVTSVAQLSRQSGASAEPAVTKMSDLKPALGSVPMPPGAGLGALPGMTPEQMSLLANNHHQQQQHLAAMHQAAANTPFALEQSFNAMQQHLPFMHPNMINEMKAGADRGACRPMAMSLGPPPQALPPGYGFFDPMMAGYPYPMDLNGARRKNATRETTVALKTWLYEHRKNPYPTKGEKIMLAIITKMTLTQVSTWFANARRRLKKENKMTWEPRNRPGEDDDDDDLGAPLNDSSEGRPMSGMSDLSDTVPNATVIHAPESSRNGASHANANASDSVSVSQLQQHQQAAQAHHLALLQQMHASAAANGHKRPAHDPISPSTPSSTGGDQPEQKKSKIWSIAETVGVSSAGATKKETPTTPATPVACTSQGPMPSATVSSTTPSGPTPFYTFNPALNMNWQQMMARPAFNPAAFMHLRPEMFMQRPGMPNFMPPNFNPASMAGAMPFPFGVSSAPSTATLTPQANHTHVSTPSSAGSNTSVTSTTESTNRRTSRTPPSTISSTSTNAPSTSSS